MIKLIIKMAVVLAEFAGSVLLLFYYFAIAGADGFMPWEAAVLLSIAALYLTRELGEAWFPQRTVTQKRTFLTFGRVMFCAALCLWFSVFFYIVLIAIAVMSAVFEKKKSGIRALFDGHLQKAGIPQKAVRDSLIRYSLLRLVREQPAWVIEAELADTKGIRRFFSEDGDIIPES